MGKLTFYHINWYGFRIFLINEKRGRKNTGFVLLDSHKNNINCVNPNHIRTCLCFSPFSNGNFIYLLWKRQFQTGIFFISAVLFCWQPHMLLFDRLELYRCVCWYKMKRYIELRTFFVASLSDSLLSRTKLSYFKKLF